MSRSLIDIRELRRPRSGPLLLAALAVPALIAGLWLSSHLAAGPSFVRAVTISNPTQYDVDVEVTNGGRHGSTHLGIAPRRGEVTVADVVDQGAQWVFAFSAGGRSGGLIQVSRRALAGADWRVTIPPAAAETLRLNGATPPP
jgi:hypothetical protein